MGDHRVDFILEVFILGEYGSLLHILNKRVYKVETLPVGGLHCGLVMEINIRLHIGRLLFLSRQGSRLAYGLL